MVAVNFTRGRNDPHATGYTVRSQFIILQKYYCEKKFME